MTTIDDIREFLQAAAERVGINLDAEQLDGVTFAEGVVRGVIEFKFADQAAKFEAERKALEEGLKANPDIEKVQFVCAAPMGNKPPSAPGGQTPPDLGRQPARAQPKRPEGVKQLIAIASGKGGVGKSTVSANLAVAMARLGKKVGLLDADVFGPSQMTMLGVTTRPKSVPEGQKIKPAEAHGIKMISMAQLLPEGEAIVWRGPMLSQVIDEFLHQVDWGELDYLFVDLPPGTGDIQLNLAQKTVTDGAIIVTTPQDIALIDARRAISMFDKLKVNVIGLIENMSTHICSQCGHEDHIFGDGGGQAEAKSRGIDFLGALPLDREIRAAADAGVPQAGQAVTFFDGIAKKLVGKDLN